MGSGSALGVNNAFGQLSDCPRVTGSVQVRDSVREHRIYMCRVGCKKSSLAKKGCIFLFELEGILDGLT